MHWEKTAVADHIDIMRILRSFKNAWQGIKYCCRNEKNFRIQLVIAGITFYFGIVFRISGEEWSTILICSGIVLGFEMLNTTLEKLSNIVTKSIHPAIKQVKDIAAGAVLLVSIISFIIGCFIFLPKFQLFIKCFLK